MAYTLVYVIFFVRSLCCANNKYSPLKIQINLIFIVKSLYIPKNCSKFVAELEN